MTVKNECRNMQQVYFKRISKFNKVGVLGILPSGSNKIPQYNIYLIKKKNSLYMVPPSHKPKTSTIKRNDMSCEHRS